MSELTMQFTDMTREDFQAHLDERSVNTHDAARVSTWFAEDGVQRIEATGQIARGRDAIREAMQTVFEAFPDLYVEVHDLFTADNRTCVQCTWSGTHEAEFLGAPATGRRVEIPACLVLRWGSSDLAEEEVIYFDAATLLRQLGLLPEA